jgi:hypothetical protein
MAVHCAPDPELFVTIVDVNFNNQEVVRRYSPRAIKTRLFKLADF